MLEDPSALILLLLLLPVILLYLLKPRPEPLRIPSLMLLVPAGKKKKLVSLFQRLVRDPLLLLQLAVITIIVLGIANPYFSAAARYGNTVIVLDNSASMSATDVSPDRFSRAVDIASGYAGNGKTSLVLAGGTPLLLFRDFDGGKALRDLRALRPGSAGTDLAGAMLLGADLLSGRKGRLVVISDFSGQDITYAQKTIEAKNIPADYVQVGSGGGNAGIVDASIGSDSIKITVKNYGDAEKVVVVRQDNRTSQKKTIQSGSVEFFTVPVHPGKNTVSLEPGDDLMVDNYFYASIPAGIKKRALILSDKDAGSPVSIALNSIPGAEVEMIPFSKSPRRFDQDMVVLSDYSVNSLLPGTADDLRKYVEAGGTLVVIAADDLPEMTGISGLLPVNVSGKAEPSKIEVVETGLAEGLDPGVSGYLKSKLKNGSVALALAPDGPVLAYRNEGRGRVIYLGMNDLWGDFHLRTSYPIFWYRLLVSGTPSTGDLNFRTGTVLPLGGKMTVIAPHSTIETSDLYLGDAGFYEPGGRTLAANLLDDKESDISVAKINASGTALEKSGAEGIEKIHLDVLLALFAVILIVLELYYLKYRGDI